MSEKARLFVVVNRAAARARRGWPSVREALVRGGVGFEAHEARMPGETERRTREALAEGFRTVAVVGGDGTLSAAAAGFFQPFADAGEGESPRPVAQAAALAVLPAGTGDDFARGLTGGRREPLDAWAARLVRHCRGGGGPGGSDSTRGVDVLACEVAGGAGRFVCLNALTLGVGAEVAALVAAQGAGLRRLPGEARFAWAAVRALAAWRDRRVRIEVDGGTWAECRTNLIAVVNGPFAGGGMNFSPAADISDGLLDALTVCDISRAELVRELLRVHRGGHLANPKVRLTRGTRVRIETLDGDPPLGVEADGDVRGHTPAEFRLVPSALRVVL
ncbi:MAG TPA: diacylglycerol kinase family protein [Pyrinomonadaceae bacterium]|nr:diacylglycerol kinase family protein [Pyrinomonadaceae bacterium]